MSLVGTRPPTVDEWDNSWLFVSIAPYSQQFNARHEAIGGIRWTN